ncbi:MAG: hypothetical protein MJZ22_04750 [Candidatus Saccharibacteria bacterium]|nr:hypothetical protein [Candidatus Saccharibacteria bacterium]
MLIGCQNSLEYYDLESEETAVERALRDSVEQARKDSVDQIIRTIYDSNTDKTYRYRKIGTQTWMIDNMDYKMEGSYYLGVHEGDLGERQKKLRAESWNGVGAFGFAALPAGFAYNTKRMFMDMVFDGGSWTVVQKEYEFNDFYGLEGSASFWSSTEYESVSVENVGNFVYCLLIDDYRVIYKECQKLDLRSVRCLKD